MIEERLLTISNFARAVGVSPSALRFYASRGILLPEEIDEMTGYRYYSPTQVDSGVLLARMRSAGLSLESMRSVLSSGSVEAVALLEQALLDHREESNQREVQLSALLADIRRYSEDGTTSGATLSGVEFASAIRQVLPATLHAEGDVAGVVCTIGPNRIDVASTDRYWLAHRSIASPTSGPPTRVILTAEDALTTAISCEREPVITLAMTNRTLELQSRRGLKFVAHSVERSVPDLRRLVSTLPPPQFSAGFDRAELLAQLSVESGRNQVRFWALGNVARVLTDDAVDGWASAEGIKTSPFEILLSRRLLQQAVSVCPGADVVIGLVDEYTPVRLESPLQGSLSCLIMPSLS